MQDAKKDGFENFGKWDVRARKREVSVFTLRGFEPCVAKETCGDIVGLEFGPKALVDDGVEVLVRHKRADYIENNVLRSGHDSQRRW